MKYPKINYPVVLLNMLFTRKSYFILICSLLMMVSCQQEDPSPFEEDNIPAPPAYTYTAAFNGISWSGTQNLSLLVKKSATSPSKEMRISASSTDGKLLTLTLSDESTGVAGDGIAVKTYQLSQNGTSDAAFVSVNTTTNATYTGAYGKVTITQSDAAGKKLTGTFECTLYRTQGDSLKITKGVLKNVPYDITEE